MSNTSNSVNNVLKSIGAIAALPLTIFALVKMVVDNPVITLVVALLTAIIASAFVVTIWKAKIEGVIIAWLILIVAMLGFFVIWPTTMTVEGTVRYTTGEPISNEKVVLIDIYGISHETQTSETGYYRFENVPNGTYKVNSREKETEGAAGGILVRILVNNLIIPAPTQTLSPTATALPTNILLPTATPTPGDFEANIEDWGDFPIGVVPRPGVGVSQYCDGVLPIPHTGKCSLKYQPPQLVDHSAYVAAKLAGSDIARSLISIWVYVPSGDLCSTNGCSTAKIIVWDNSNKWTSYEGESVALDHIGWVEVKMDLSDISYLEPHRAVGVHFYLVTEYQGAFYIDTVTIAKP
jgi:hypothetical protein